LRSDLCAFIAVANERGDLEIRVCVCYCVENIASNVACSTGAVRVLVAALVLVGVDVGRRAYMKSFVMSAGGGLQ
jgi:hypothetical protein